MQQPRIHRRVDASCAHYPAVSKAFALFVHPMHTQSLDGALDPPSSPIYPSLILCWCLLAAALPPFCILFINGSAWNTGNLKGYLHSRSLSLSLSLSLSRT